MSEIYFDTSIGQVRSENEDRAYIETLPSGDVFMVVLDGMGGYQNGALAAQTALDYLQSHLNNLKVNSKFNFIHKLVKLIKQTNKEVNKLTQSYVTNIVLGTTLVCCYVSKDDLYIANIGDSRCYILEDKNLTQISEDQTYTNYLYKAGKITKEELETHPQKHVLTNALGTYPSVMVQTYHLKKIPQIILLCSDGLYNMVNNFEISEVLNSSLSLKEKGELLIKKANENGGKDNIAVALWEGNQYENR